MKIIKGYPVCEGCKFTTLHNCLKYNMFCPSLCLGTTRYQISCVSCMDEDGYEQQIIANDINDKNNSLIANLHVPGPENFDIFKSMIKFQEFYPEACYKNRKITEIYGAFGGAIWNGRTPDYGGIVLTIQDINKMRIAIEELGLTMNLTWNNHLVSGFDVYDRFCNAITEVFHNGKHAITVASPELFNYLKEKYPNFKYYQSVISTSNDKIFIKKDQKFDMFLMNRNLNNNWEELLKIPEEERGAIEFLCNDLCTPTCNRMKHYDIVNNCLLNRNDEFLGNYCTIDHDFSLYNMRKWPITINPEDIDIYLKSGFCHFKLCSRGDSDFSTAYRVLVYLVKPEYLPDAYMWTMQRLVNTETIRKSIK